MTEFVANSLLLFSAWCCVAWLCGAGDTGGGGGYSPDGASASQPASQTETPVASGRPKTSYWLWLTDTRPKHIRHLVNVLPGCSPEVHERILVVASVEVDLVWVDDDACQQDQQHLHRLLPPVHEVAVKHVRVVTGRDAVLEHGRNHRWD